LASPIFIGREPELHSLIELATRPPGVAVVEGEAGVGKTRLVRELIDHPSVAKRRIIVGRCYPMRDPFPLGPVIEALQGTEGLPPSAPLSAVAGAVRPLLPELGRHLPRRPPPLDDPQAERHRLFRGLRELLGALGPTVCVLEDLHWADEGTLELLPFLVFNQPETLMLVLTHRSEEPSRCSWIQASLARDLGATSRTIIELASLSWKEVRRLVSAILGTEDVSEEFACALHARTGGIPFAVEEVVRLLRERGEVALVNGPSPGRALARLDVPPGLRRSVIERIGSLGPDARLMAGAAAVLGRPGREELMAKLAGLGPRRGAKAIISALSCAVLEEKQEGLYGFRHPLAAQAVYEQIPGPERRRLHLRAAQALESGREPRPLGQVAHHYKQAGRVRQCLRYAEAAAEAASSQGDDRTAVRILQDVLVAAELPRATRTRMALKLGEAACLGRIPGVAIPFLREALDNGPLPAGVRGELRFSLGRVLWSAGELSSAFDEMTRAAEELRARPGRAAAVMVVLAAADSRMHANGDGQLLQLDRASGLAHDDPAVQVAVRAARAYVLLYRGDPAGWRVVQDLPWSASSLQQRRALLWACSTYLPQVAVRLGYYRRADSLLREGVRISHEMDHGRFAVELATRRAWLDWSSGRWQGLEATARELMDASLELPGRLASSELTLAWLLLVRGELNAAERSFQSVLEFVRTRAPAPLATSMTGLATIQLARGDPDRARELATQALVTIREKGLWTCASTLAPIAVDALVACGRTAEAGDVTREYGRGLRGRDAPAARAALAVCRGALAQAENRRDVAIDHFAQAERAWRRLPAPYQAAKARERRGWCLLGQAGERGSDQLLDALVELDTLGAAWDAARVRAGLRNHGLSAPHPSRRGRPAYGKGLSPREAEVARLAAGGETNKEIAKVLFISPRTVEKHVASALMKRRVASRRDLTAEPSPPGAPAQ